MSTETQAGPASTGEAAETGRNGEEPVLTQLEHGVLLVRLNRPHRLNAFDDSMLLHLGRVFRQAAADSVVKSVIMTGTGRGFCAGADIKSTWEPDSALFGLRRRLNPVILAMAALQKPLISALHGAVAGAGLGFAGVADVRIAARNCVFVPATVKLGIVPDGGMTYFVPRLIGPGRAFQWLCGGEHIGADEALQWGLVDMVVDDDELLDRAIGMARLFNSAPGASVRLTKGLLRSSAGSTLAEQLELEHQAQDEAHLDPFHQRSQLP